MYWCGRCNRCDKNVNSSPGLGYANYSGSISYCHGCLEETQLGDRFAKVIDGRRTPIWLDDVIGLNQEVKRFYLGRAERKWDSEAPQREARKKWVV